MSESRLVYSTDGKNLCPKCGKTLHKCNCPAAIESMTGNGLVTISRETKGRKGAGVTLISGVEGSASELKKIARQLKSKCGVGGTIKAGVIEIQGDQRQRAKEFFEENGKKVKLAGG